MMPMGADFPGWLEFRRIVRHSIALGFREVKSAYPHAGSTLSGVLARIKHMMRAVGWRPEIGDPTLTGWVVTVCYLATAVVCARLAWTGWKRRLLPARSILFWVMVSGFLLFLGINKQLDLQTALTLAGRRIALRDGWYGERRIVENGFVAALAVGEACGLAAFLWLFRRLWREICHAVLGVAILFLFILLRADGWEPSQSLAPVIERGHRLGWILELTGIALIAYSAVKATMRMRREYVAPACESQTAP
ncbi:MAG: hypothetical protein NTW86_15395 [Candidatus Sumerlaeota bacterium]|nr:hypothetical protein [Candidatus Sumerlaeota bacterium]